MIRSLVRNAPPRDLAVSAGERGFPATGIFRRGGHEGDEEIGESSDDEFVGALGVEGEIAREELMQVIPILLHVVDSTRLHHLLHGSPEVDERIRGVGRHGDGGAAAHGVALAERRRGGGGGDGGGGVDDRVGAAGGGEEKAAGGEDGGDVGGGGVGVG